jgi:PAS domain S-box-containing protein
MSDDAEGAPTVQELREARDHLRAVTDSMGQSLCTLDDAGHVSYMNPAAERMLGWSIDELRGRTLHEATHYRRPDGSPYPIDDCPLYGGHRARKAVRVDDDMFIRRDGSGVDVSWVLTPFHSSTGANSVVVFSDNTLAKAAQQRLQGEIERLSQVRDLHEALQEQRFELFSQPIIDVASGTVVSYELLLRMRERDGGIRTPTSFLPVAESCGLIREIDRWVIGEAARLAGDGHRVEFNLSATSLGDPALFEHLAEAVAKNDADPSQIVIELTETALMQEEAIARTFVERVRAMGCGLALDDFGTGFGGFSYLKRLPVDYLKIDVEFVRDLCTSAASQHVVKAVVGLAHAFGQLTIAEGVEDAQTLEMVRAMGVDYAQGFGIGCPAPLSETLVDTSSIAVEGDPAGDAGPTGEDRATGATGSPGGAPSTRTSDVFCGRGRKVTFGKRSVSKRGATIRRDIDAARGVMSRGVRSPAGQMFVDDGEILLSALAEAVHAGVDPGPPLTRQTRKFVAFGRNFREAAIGASIRRSGMSAEEAAVRMRAGEWDPWADVQIPT